MSNATLSHPIAQRPVTTTDAWKTLGLIVITMDHVGHYFLPDWPMLRAIARSSLLIWFFFLGFGRGGAMPMRWLVFGVLLTVLDYLRLGRTDQVLINILFSFALIRLTFPFVERFILPSLWGVAALVAALIALSPLAKPILEYGTMGPLIALAGLVHRRVLEAPDSLPRYTREALGLIAILAFGISERNDYGFSPHHLVVMALGLLITMAALLRFERKDFLWQPSGWIARAMQFCGRWSLELYVGQLVLFTLINWLLNIDIFADEDE